MMNNNGTTRQPMQDVKVLEVAQYTFTPAAGAILADWGADVIKVEHAEMGDAQRGIELGAVSPRIGSFKPLMEHPNRGKKSVGLALEHPDARQILLELVASSDVFLTNFLPAARRRLGIDVDDIRAANPSIIYVRGSAYGPKGKEAERGGYDGSVFWSLGGLAIAATPRDAPRMIHMPSPAFGDSIGGMTLAGGIAAALYMREKTGQPSVVDVSLMSMGAWVTGLALNNALLTESVPQRPLAAGPHNVPANPIVGDFPTADGRWVTLTLLQPGKFWPEVCKRLEIEHLTDDPRFDSAQKLMEHADEAGALISEAFRKRTLVEWMERFAGFDGVWAPNRDWLEAARDPQMRANGYIVPVVDADGVQRELVSSPVQFDEIPFDLRRAPQFAEHTDEVVSALGRSTDELIKLKLEGAIS